MATKEKEISTHKNIFFDDDNKMMIDVDAKNAIPDNTDTSISTRNIIPTGKDMTSENIKKHVNKFLGKSKKPKEDE
jgi:hypothetical protein